MPKNNPWAGLLASMLGHIQVTDELENDEGVETIKGARLLGSVKFGGCSFHIDCIEVVDGRAGQAARDLMYDDTLGHYFEASGNQAFDKVEIKARMYAVFLHPFDGGGSPRHEDKAVEMREQPDGD